MSKRARRMRLVGGGLVVLGGLALVGVGVAWWVVRRLEPELRARIQREAEARGVELELGVIELWPGSVGLDAPRFRLRGTRCVSGTARRIEVTLDGLTPSSVSAIGVDVDVSCTPTALALELGTWLRDHPRATASPFAAADVTLRWAERPGAAPWLTLTKGSVAKTQDGASLHADDLRVAGLALGSVDTAWGGDGANAAIGLGGKDPATAPLRLRVESAATPPRATLTLSPTPLASLARVLGVAPGIEATASGFVRLDLPKAGAATELPGDASLTLEGWLPPHPRELDGIVAGPRTTVTTRIAIAADRRSARFDPIKLGAGGFQLAGTGRLTSEAPSARLVLALSGNIPCRDIASSVVKQRAGDFLGGLVDAHSPIAVTGSVGVRVLVDARLAELDRLKLDPVVGVGCGLKSKALPGLGTLKLGELQKLPDLPLPLPEP